MEPKSDRFSNPYEEAEDFLGNFLEITLSSEESEAHLDGSFLITAKENISRAGQNALEYMIRNAQHAYQVSHDLLRERAGLLQDCSVDLSLCRDISKIFLTAIQDILAIERRSPVKVDRSRSDTPVSARLDGISYTDPLYKTMILILEDEVVNSRKIARFLADCVVNKTDILIAENCSAAIRLLAENGPRIGLAFIDDSLPDGVGSALTQNILSKDYPHITAFSVTSNSALRHHYKDFGFDGYLGKPFDKPDLVSMLNKKFKQQLLDDACRKLWTAPSRGK